MKNSSVAVLETVIVTDNSEEEILILSEISSGGEQPTIAKFTLLHIETRVALNEELGIFADFGRSQPFVVTIRTTREEQTLIDSLKLGILEE